MKRNLNMDIERINDYDDPRFPKEVLNQHGAFVVDGKYPCSFRIIDETTAEIDFHDYSDVTTLIENFRFYAEHVTVFCDKSGKVIAEFPKIKTFPLGVGLIQPSQFYVDEDKVNAVSDFIASGNDIVIPVMKRDGRYISLDGHTRLYYAYTRGWNTVRAFEAEVNDYVLEFVEEAKKRGVSGVGNMELLSHSEYELKWNKFCDDFFAAK